MIDPRILAVDHSIIVYSTLQELRKPGFCSEDSGKPEDYGRGLRSRAREAPSLLAQSGVASLLTFYASKSSADSFEQLVKYLEAVTSKAQKMEEYKNNVEKNVSNYKKVLCEELKPGEAKGYGLMLALIAHVLKSYGLWQGKLDFIGLAKTTRAMLREPAKDQVAQTVLLEYLLHFKRMIEAIISP